MRTTELNDTALILLGHGTDKNAASATPVIAHAEALRRDGRFARVEPAFWKQAPRVRDVLAAATEPCVFIVPFFATAGYFCDEIIPRELGFPAAKDGGTGFQRSRREGHQTWFYTAPVGTHSRITDLLLMRAREVLNQHPFPARAKPDETAMIVVGHGTPRSGKSRAGVEARVEALRERGEFAEVHAVYLEEPPLVSDWWQLTERRQVVVVPFLLSDGLHGGEDVPVLLGEREEIVRERLAQGRFPWRNPTERRGRRLWYARSPGSLPEMQELMLDRVREMV
jgi:sirohydrochlorin cobaltochelatase